MARIKLLTARQIETLGPGVHSDGANLYLRVREPSDTQRQAGQLAGSRAWVFQYERAKRAVQIGLGSTADRSLAQARNLAGRMRTALADGGDPGALLRARRSGDAITFKGYAAELVAAKQIGWKSAVPGEPSKHGKQWTATLTAYAFPTLGNKRPGDISVADVKAVLNPLWATKTETASRLRQRIEAVIDYAAVHEGDERRNPARWKGNLDKLFQSPRKVTKPVHHPALPYDKVPGLMDQLRQKQSTSAFCLRWTILEAPRSGEARGARWPEINEAEKVWIVPPERMKGGREHRVPLCNEAMQILGEMKKRKVIGCEYVFPGAMRRNKATGVSHCGLLSDVALNKALHAFEPEVTVHGFRSSFRDWVGEATTFQRELAEMSIAHVVGDETEQAYSRGTALAKRRKLMDAWAGYAATKSNVVRLVKIA